MWSKLAVPWLLVCFGCAPEKTRSAHESVKGKPLCAPKLQMTASPFENQVTVSQGVWGTVNYQYYGTCGPWQTPADREVVFYMPVTAQTPQKRNDLGSYFAAVTGTIVASTKSDHDGFFQIAMTAGTYSAFVIEGSEYYTNLPVAPFMSLVTVPTGKTAQVEFVFQAIPQPSYSPR